MFIKRKYALRIQCAIALCGLVALGMGCVAPDPEDGAIMATLSGAGDHDGSFFQVFVLPVGVDPASATDEQIFAVGIAQIASGTAETACKDPDTQSTAIIFGGDQEVAVVSVIDVAGNGDVDSGVDYATDVKTVEIDGDVVVAFSYPSEYVLVP